MSIERKTVLVADSGKKVCCIRLRSYIATGPTTPEDIPINPDIHVPCVDNITTFCNTAAHLFNLLDRNRISQDDFADLFLDLCDKEQNGPLYGI